MRNRRIFMENCLGIINHYNMDNEMGDLARHRPAYMVPFAGRYRIIDVAMSNMVNNGISTVAVIIGDKIRSALDHLGSGGAWKLNSRFQGLFLFPPQPQDPAISRLGDIKDFFNMVDFFDMAREDNIFIIDSNVILKDSFDDIYKEFVDTDSDMALLYQRVSDPEGKYLNLDKLHINEDGLVQNLGINLGIETDFNLYVKAFFIKKSVFLDVLKRTAEKGNAYTIRDVIAQNLSSYKTLALETDGYMEIISDVNDYYKANMALLDMANFNKLFYENGMITTKTKDEPPTEYGQIADIGPCLIANGCSIKGDVENSIISRAVTIEEGALVRNSIIMEKTTIKKGAVIINSIVDRSCVIEENANLIGSVNEPYVLGRNQKVGAMS